MNGRRRAKRPTLAKRTRLARRDMLRERRREGAGKTIYDLRAAMARPDAQLALAGLRVKLLLQRYSMGDGIAYIPYDALGEAAPAPRSGGVPAARGGYLEAFRDVTNQTPSTAPINGAYWMDDQDWVNDPEGHTFDRRCPLCGPCEKCDDQCAKCFCCKCEKDRMHAWEASQ